MTGIPQPEKDPPMLDGVGITPEPAPEVLAPPLASDDVSAPTAPDIPEESTVFGIPESVDRNVQRIFFRAYSLISAALLVSAAVASRVTTAVDQPMIIQQGSMQMLFIFEVVCVAALTRYVPKLPRELAAFLLFFCAVFNGVSFTFFLIWFPPSAIAYGFLVSSLAFGISAAVSRWRRIDLSSWIGTLLLFGAGLGLVATLTLALRLDLAYWETSFGGFMIFAALACYFAVDIGNLDLEFDDDPSEWKAAICGALILYLNFVNLYLILLRLTTQKVEGDPSGRRRVRF